MDIVESLVVVVLVRTCTAFAYNIRFVLNLVLCLDLSCLGLICVALPCLALTISNRCTNACSDTRSATDPFYYRNNMSAAS